MNNKVWYVTGASKGLGLSLVKKLLQQGYKVAATSRSAAELKKAVGGNDADFLPLAVALDRSRLGIEHVATRRHQLGPDANPRNRYPSLGESRRAHQPEALAAPETDSSAA